MRRRLFNLAAAVSLVLCVSSTVLWVRSYALLDNAWWGDELTRWDVNTASGELEFCYGWPNWPGSMHQYVGLHMETVGLASPRATPTPWQGRGFHALGFHAGTKHGVSGSWYSLIIPLWFIVAVTALMPARVIFKWMRRQHNKLRMAERILAGRCPTCGYDLRATPGRCPECGAHAKPQPAEGAAA